MKLITNLFILLNFLLSFSAQAFIISILNESHSDKKALQTAAYLTEKYRIPLAQIQIENAKPCLVETVASSIVWCIDKNEKTKFARNSPVVWKTLASLYEKETNLEDE